MNSTTTFTPGLTFPDQKVGTVGTKSTPVSVVIKNTGQIDMVVSNFSVSGDFKISKNYCNVGIRPGTHCNIYVSFAPTRTGLRLGTLKASDNSTNSKQAIALSGRGY